MANIFSCSANINKMFKKNQSKMLNTTKVITFVLFSQDTLYILYLIKFDNKVYNISVIPIIKLDTDMFQNNVKWFLFYSILYYGIFANFYEKKKLGLRVDRINKLGNLIETVRYRKLYIFLDCSKSG